MKRFKDRLRQLDEQQREQAIEEERLAEEAALKKAELDAQADEERALRKQKKKPASKNGRKGQDMMGMNSPKKIRNQKITLGSEST